MSELIVNKDQCAVIRWKLLAGASVLVLASHVSSNVQALASEDGKPTVWIELDTQFANQSVGSEPFIPAFVQSAPFDAGLHDANKHPPSEWFEDGKISYKVPQSDWVLSLGVRYGRSSRGKAAAQYTSHPTAKYYKFINAYQESHAQSSEKHLILDFKAGKDFGLGILGQKTNSVFSFGLRYAQFDSRQNGSVESRPSTTKYNFSMFLDSFDSERSFKGVGPSLSWDGSAPLVGNPADGSLTIDWGVNGALLFGRQRMKGHHQKTAEYQASSSKYGPPPTVVYHTANSPSRSRNVTVPNLGGYAALSLRYTNAKVTLGYRADWFFGAIDGGFDTRKTFDRGFYGPYASFSIGLGG